MQTRRLKHNLYMIAMTAAPVVARNGLNRAFVIVKGIPARHTLLTLALQRIQRRRPPRHPTPRQRPRRRRATLTRQSNRMRVAAPSARARRRTRGVGCATSAAAPLCIIPPTRKPTAAPMAITMMGIVTAVCRSRAAGATETRGRHGRLHRRPRAVARPRLGAGLSLRMVVGRLPVRAHVAHRPGHRGRWI